MFGRYTWRMHPELDEKHWRKSFQWCGARAGLQTDMLMPVLKTFPCTALVISCWCLRDLCTGRRKCDSANADCSVSMACSGLGL